LLSGKWRKWRPRLKINITNKEIQLLLELPATEFPKYTTQLINLASQNAQATRPKVVGQMSELIKQFPKKHWQEWEEWYLEKHPEAIATATEKIVAMLGHLKNAMSQVDRELVTQWVRDLVIVKTFIGLRFQEAVLKKVSQRYKTTFRMGMPDEENKGIDGYIDKQPVSIKPTTYQAKQGLSEQINVPIIFYSKKKNGIVIEFDEKVFDALLLK
jgi:hypothetical protein